MPGKFLNLLSNADLVSYPFNEPSFFATSLDEPIRCPNGSMVALTEVSYQCSHKLNQGGGSLDVFDFLYEHKNPDPGNGVTYGKLYSIPINNPELPTGASLATLLNKLIWEKVKRLKEGKVQIFTFDHQMNRLWVTFSPNAYITLQLHAGLVSLCGVETHHARPEEVVTLGRSKNPDYFIYKDGTKRTFDRSARQRYRSVVERCDYFLYPPNLLKIESFILYSNLGVDQTVANTRSSLLRFVNLPVEPTTGRVTKDFGNSLHYIPLKGDVISEIRISLKDLNGNSLPLSSYTRVCLHIKTPDI